MEILISMGIAALLEGLQDRKALPKIAAKVAKVFVAIERTAESSPLLTAAIEKARTRP